MYKGRKIGADERINLIFISLSLDIGGIETLILEICKRINTRKYAPKVCVFEKNGALQAEFEEADIPLYILENNQGLDISLPFRLALLLKKLNADIVHTHNHSVWLYGGIAAKIANVPLVHTEHTSPHYNVKRWYKIERYLSLVTNKITAVSQSISSFMIEKEHITADKIEVIHNGIDCESYQVKIDKAEKRKELGIREKDLVIGNVARFFPNKDQECLLKAFRIVSDRVPESKLLIAGDGPLKNSLFQLREELKLKDNVQFLGNRRDIPELLKVFDVFALSSIKEGLPITILEAMASGLPVVATDVDGNPEVVINNNTGYIVPPKNPKLLAEKIIKLLLNGETRRKMGQNSRERVEREFSFDKMISKYDTLYRSIVGKNRDE